MPILSNRAKGLLITTIGGLALSFDVPLVRLSGGSAWNVITYRGFLTFAAAFVVWLVLGWFGRKRPVLVPGIGAAVAGAVYGLSSLFFIGAVFNTASANVVFIVAFSPMFAALLAFLFLREKLKLPTLLTMLAMIAGVGIIVSGSIGGGTILGDFIAVGAAFLIALAITIGRGLKRDLGFVPLIGALLPALIGLYFTGLAFTEIPAPGWLIFDGAVMIPIAFFCLATGPRYLKAAEVGMFYLLETVLAPVWLWLIFDEMPPTQSLLGGAVLIGALLAYSLYELRVSRRGPAEAR